MKRTSRPHGLSLIEVMVAILVLAIGAVPIFAVNSASHADTTDAVAFLALVDRLEEQVAAAAAGPQGTASVKVAEGPRELTQLVRTDDRHASFAPVCAPASAAPEVLP